MLSCASSTYASNAFDRDRLREIDRTIERAIAEQKLPGGVFHLERHGAVYEKAYGRRAIVPASEAMTADTIFDAASITKAVATTPSIWLLIQRGKIELDAPVIRYIPEYRGGWRDEVTIRHLLTHTSALRPDLDLSKPWSGPRTALAMMMSEEPTNRPGVIFRYSDINFELLGEIVHRVSGVPLDIFAKREVFKPLGMKDSGFRRIEVTESDGLGPAVPMETKAAEKSLGRIAPTEMTNGRMLRGEVHDPTARRMGGVAGHAGLFGTADGVSRMARALLCTSLGEGTPLGISAQTVRRFWQRGTVPGSTWGLGWDHPSPLDPADPLPHGPALGSPREVLPSSSAGTLWSRDGVGHLGFTGCSLWIDPAPQARRWVVFLANRVDVPAATAAEAQRRMKHLRPRLHDALHLAFAGGGD